MAQSETPAAVHSDDPSKVTIRWNRNRPGGEAPALPTFSVGHRPGDFSGSISSELFAALEGTMTKSDPAFTVETDGETIPRATIHWDRNRPGSKAPVLPTFSVERPFVALTTDGATITTV